VVKKGTNEKIFDYTEEVAKIEGASATQYTIDKILPLQNFEPGVYELKLKVTDRNSESVITPSATFKVI
jgi:hypothetical protein